MSWIKLARGLKRISSRELADMCGKSMNYIQKIEAGDRELPDSTAGEIYEALGFNPAQVPFNTSYLLDELEGMADDETVLLDYFVVDGIIYFNSILVDSGREEDGLVRCSVKSAKLLLKSQLTLFG